MLPFDPGAPWRGFDPSTFDVDVPEFRIPSDPEATLTTCYSILPPEQAAGIDRIARLADSDLFKAAERVRSAMGYGDGSDRDVLRPNGARF